MIIARETKDTALIKSVIGRIWDEVSDGSIAFEDWFPSDQEIWLEVEHQGELLGVYGIRFLSPFTIEGHANVLPEHRRQHTTEITKAVAKWMKNNLSEDFTELVVCIPSDKPNVLKYAYRIGFKEKSKILSIPLEKFYE